MRRIITFMLIFMLTLSFTVYETKAQSSPPKISADGVVLMDASTGEILYSKNMDTQYPPASTTKIMTALLTLENTNLDDVVTVGKNPPSIDGSKVYLFEGEKLTVRDLLHALLLQSANDAALTLAEHISGSNEEFAKLMNKRAAELGCVNTNFVNPSGLYDDKHRTTSRDLALILKELSKHLEFINIATTSMYYIQPTNKSKEKRPLWNENRLVQKNSSYYYEGCEAGKTGYTVQSKHSFVAMASRNGQKLIAVLLHDEKKTYWSDVRKLFDYGFENFSMSTFYSKGDSVGEHIIKEGLKVPLLAAEDFYYVKSKDSTEVPELKIISKDLSTTSFNRGENILTAEVLYKGKSIGVLNLASAVDYTYKNPIASLKNTNNSTDLLKLSLYIAAFFILLITLLRARKKLKQRKKQKQNKIIKDIYMSKYKNNR
ncbi:D-alanyl-D-alanine carboxypeptidase [Clostridium bovifaecis]|uniref:serine-type D-Ala-D-Ala carboxypeptidase n=1 Tax=Clostridium bovifaecis TaxID=2184719 RepID=A0A6I6EP91_9CLOT|nr:D-alanyl-D-alanine carboxypeptidase [Clostridium bovifaecis]